MIKKVTMAYGRCNELKESITPKKAVPDAPKLLFVKMRWLGRDLCLGALGLM